MQLAWTRAQIAGCLRNSPGPLRKSRGAFVGLAGATETQGARRAGCAETVWVQLRHPARASKKLLQPPQAIAPIAKSSEEERFQRCMQRQNSTPPMYDEKKQ